MSVMSIYCFAIYISLELSDIKENICIDITHMTSYNDIHKIIKKCKL